MVLADSMGAIVDGLSMRDNFIVYKDQSTYSISYVAGQYVYTQRKNFLTAGVQSSNCVVEINGNHWCFTGSDVIRHDGQSFESVIQYKVKNELTNGVDPSLLAVCCVVSKQSQRQVWVCIPEPGKGHLSKAYIINTDTLECGIRTLPLIDFVARGVVLPADVSVAWDNDPDAWQTDNTFWNQATYTSQNDSLLMVDFDSAALWSVDTIDSADGQPVNAYAERLSLPIDEVDTIERRFVTRLIPRIEGEAGAVINISIGSQAFFGQAIKWAPPFPFLIGISQAVPCQVEGRFLSVRFESDTIPAWKIHSYLLEFATLGLY
jgi:hypothetical protein